MAPETIRETVRGSLQRYMDQEDMHRLEGRKGLENLCKLARALGYKDPQYFGTLTSDAAVGDLINFLEDNSGAIEAIIEWIAKQHSPEMIEALSALLPEDTGE